MSRISCLLIALAIVFFLAEGTASAQEHAGHHDQAVAGGGIAAEGWMGMVDRGSNADVNASHLAEDGDALHIKTGPSVAYWRPENTASGTYRVSATFTEPAYMNVNDHPHPYGLFIGGSDLGTDQARYLYCAAYGNGSFIVRGFGAEPFQLNGRRAQQHDAVNKASGQGQPVTQEIAIDVDEENVTCIINGEEVASYPISEVVGEGRLASTDGVYGIRFAHNVEGRVADLTLTND